MKWLSKHIKDIKRGREELDEAKRHNQTMETISVGSKGLYLKPYRKGCALYLQQHSKKRPWIARIEWLIRRLGIVFSTMTVLET